MKKTVLCLLLLTMLLSLTACAHTHPPVTPPTTTPTIPPAFDARIEKVYDHTLYVQSSDETETYFFVNRCDFITHNGQTITYDDLSVGDQIRILYYGDPVGSSPSQITDVLEIKLISALTEQ